MNIVPIRHRSYLTAFIVILLTLPYWQSGLSANSAENAPITVYRASKIITMDPTNAVADAVAVRGKRIVAVGSMEDLKPWLENYSYTINERFSEKILMPGLIDPHLHPMLGAIQLRTKWITPESWELHDEKVEAVVSPEAFQSRLRDLLAAEPDKSRLLIAWGWSEPYHGPLTRSILDQMSPDQPVFVWQRSVHEGVFNTSALKLLKLTEADTTSYHTPAQANWETGHFVEGGFFDIVVPRLASILFDPEFIDGGFDRNNAYLLSRGVTTVGDMSTGAVNWELELAALKRNISDKNTPLRVVLVPDAFKMIAQKGGFEEAYSFIDNQLNNVELPRSLVGGKRIKLFSDGAMFSLGMQLNKPGYLGFGQGEWITPLGDFRKLARKYWNENYKVYVHTNGDKGADFVLSVFEELQVQKPRLKNSVSLEHYGYANERLNRRVAELGAAVSANPYYVTFLGDTYSKVGLGPDRARRITPVRGLVDRGVLVALHSDFGMAPADPLALAWAAITRQTLSGRKMTPPGGLTREEALRAITVDAAHHLGLEKEIGSIEAGKLADFAILEEDPTTVPIDKLKRIQIWGVVYEGEARKAQ